MQAGLRADTECTAPPRAVLWCAVLCCACVQGVPCVQAVGEAEAMCAALNLCGWVHAAHTADVDALLFGALTVYRQMHLQVGGACSCVTS